MGNRKIRLESLMTSVTFGKSNVTTDEALCRAVEVGHSGTKMFPRPSFILQI